MAGPSWWHLCVSQLPAAAPQLPQPTEQRCFHICPVPHEGFWVHPGGGSALSPPEGDTHLADGVEGPHVLEPAVGQPVGDLGAVQQPLPPAEITMLAQHPAGGQDGTAQVTLGWQGTPSGRQGTGAHLHPSFDPHGQHVVVETLCLETPHLGVELDLLPLKTLQPVQEDGGLREKLWDWGKRGGVRVPGVGSQNWGCP